jgi:tetratricopeptide (TPR) repeat protein
LAYAGLKRIPEAMDALNRSLAINEAIKDTEGACKNLQNLGQQLFENDNPNETYGYFVKALDLRRQMPTPDQLVQSLACSATVVSN